MAINISRTDTHIVVKSIYNKEFVAKAHNLAGKYNDRDKSWSFDIRDEADVLEACYLCYGEDGYRSNLCDVQISLPEGYFAYQDTINFYGRPIARAFGRDSGAKLFDGIKIVEGGFDSGGSMKNWTTRALKGTVIVLRDVSYPLVTSTTFDEDENVHVEIISHTESGITADQADLVKEKAQLLARLAEINAVLGA